MKNKKFFALLVGVLALAGCFKPNQGSSTPVESTPAESTPTPTTPEQSSPVVSTPVESSTPEAVFTPVALNKIKAEYKKTLVNEIVYSENFKEKNLEKGFKK